MHNPTNTHFANVKHILRYLKGTPSLGLYYSSNHLDLTAYSDVD